MAGGFISPHEVRLLEAFSLGGTVRLLAILDGVILVLNCAFFPIMLLLLLWVSGSVLVRRERRRVGGSLVKSRGRDAVCPEVINSRYLVFRKNRSQSVAHKYIRNKAFFFFL